MSKVQRIKSVGLSSFLIGLLSSQICLAQTAGNTSGWWLDSDMLLAKKASLKTCRKLQAKQDKYTELRRRGGSAVKMDGWKRSKRDAAAEFRKQDCHKWSKKRLG